MKLSISADASANFFHYFCTNALFMVWKTFFHHFTSSICWHFLLIRLNYVSQFYQDTFRGPQILTETGIFGTQSYLAAIPFRVRVFANNRFANIVALHSLISRFSIFVFFNHNDKNTASKRKLNLKKVR